MLFAEFLRRSIFPCYEWVVPILNVRIVLGFLATLGFGCLAMKPQNRAVLESRAFRQD